MEIVLKRPKKAKGVKLYAILGKTLYWAEVYKTTLG